METIGPIEYQREPYICHPASPVAPFDPENHHNRDRGGDQDGDNGYHDRGDHSGDHWGDPADDAPHSGITPRRNAVSPQHRLDVMA